MPCSGESGDLFVASMKKNIQMVQVHVAPVAFKYVFVDNFYDVGGRGLVRIERIEDVSNAFVSKPVTYSYSE